MALSGPFPDYQNACLTSQNMAELFAYLGDIFSSESVAQEALSVAVQRGNEYDQMQAMAHIAWAAYLNGDLEKAGDFFKAAEMVGGAAVTELTHTYNRGIYYADYLLRIGELDRASQITKGNLSVLGVERRLPQISQCFRILGDIDSLRGDHSRARHSYNHALRIARGITYRPALIEALLARGRWMGRVLGDPHPALEDLNEALAYATEGGFLIYEVDIRIASSWALLALEIIDSALAEGERAKRMSVEMQYYWGKTGAEEVLPKIKMRRGHLF
jgi:tetratricopeptide (TPR) repeat protein